jgi:hypothetical protein
MSLQFTTFLQETHPILSLNWSFCSLSTFYPIKNESKLKWPSGVIDLRFSGDITNLLFAENNIHVEIK